MKRICKSLLAIFLMLYFCSTCFAATGTPIASKFVVTGYTVNGIANKDGTAKTTKTDTIEKENYANIVVNLWCSDASITAINVGRDYDDSFSGTGIIAASPVDSSAHTCTVTLSNLIYSGGGNTLSFFVGTGSDKNPTDQISVTVKECDYKEPTPVPDTPTPTPVPDYDYDPPEPTAAPRAVITYSGLPELLASGETATVKLDIKNTGKTAMKAPILNFTVSDALLITDAKYTVALSDIAAGKTASVSVPVKAFGKVAAQKQSIDVAMTFDYYNNVSTTSSEASAHIIVPCKLSDSTEEEPTTGSKPVPIVILSGYSYGGASIAAGSEADLHFTFTNTSKLLAVENIVLKVTTGANLQLNGSSNTFYFESVAAGGSKSVTLPLKAVPMISGSTQDVGLSFSYEYVDNEQRRERTSEMSISVPLYQPDRFELSEPVVAYVGFVGEETSLTMDYVNKGKTEVSNVEATISGDVDSYNSFVRLGNIPSGKSGTIAFAVTPMLEGDNKATITVSYEDANGDVQERVFETTLSAMAMEPFDPGEWEDPMEPIEEPSQFPWWIIAVALAVVTIIVGVVVSKRKKKAKLAKQQELWDEWDDDDSAAKAVATTEAKSLPESADAATEEAVK